MARRSFTTASASALVCSCGLCPSILASAASNVWPPLAQSASMLQYSTGVNARIARSRSTMRRRATVCTRPADSPVRMLRQRIGLALYPTSRSRIRRACWASTFRSSIFCGLAMARSTPLRVISSKSTRLTGALVSSWPATCQAIASPSRSGSVARKTRLAALGRLLDIRQGLGLALDRDVLGLEAVVDVHAELPGGQVPDMADRGLHAVAAAQILADGLGLGGRLDDHQPAARGQSPLQRSRRLAVRGPPPPSARRSPWAWPSWQAASPVSSNQFVPCSPGYNCEDQRGFNGRW